MRAKIIGTGSCLPEKTVTNNDLSKRKPEHAALISKAAAWTAPSSLCTMHAVLGVTKSEDTVATIIRSMSSGSQELLTQAGLAPTDINWYLLHQANQRIISSIARKLKLPLDKFPSNLDHCGNTSAASG